MRWAAEQIQLASLPHLFYLIGYGRIVGHSQVGRLPAFCCDRAVAFRRTESSPSAFTKRKRTHKSVCLSTTMPKLRSDTTSSSKARAQIRGCERIEMRQVRTTWHLEDELQTEL